MESSRAKAFREELKLGRELRAIKVARAEEARARLVGLLQIQANLEVQIREARLARDNAERDARDTQ